MSKPSNTSTNQSIEDILKDLEKKFGSDPVQPTAQDKKDSSFPRKSNPSLSPSLLTGVLVFTLLVVGVASAMWLGGRSQDLRQLAVYTGEPCSPNGITTCDAGTQYTCNAGEWQPTGTCTSPTSTPITCAGSSDSRCQGDAGGTICDNINGINYVCQPGSGNNYNACTCERQDNQCSTPQVQPLQNRECVADDNTTDQCVGIGKEGDSCQISDLCQGGTGTCRVIAGQGDNARGNCTCVRGGGPNPSPSVSPSLSPTPTPTPTPGGGGGGNTPTPTPTPNVCPAENRITFSTLPTTGTRPADNLIITDQFASQGVTFSIRPLDGDTGTTCQPNNGPRIARVGTPQTAFQGPAASNGNTADQPASGQGVGQDFLTDNGTVGAGTGPTCITVMDILPGFRTTRVEFDIIDIDSNDTFLIQALNENGTVIQTQTVPNGNFNAQARRITVTAPNPIAQIQIIPNHASALTTNWGLAYDNVCLFPPPPSPTPTSTPTPTPSPTPAPICLSLTMSPPNPTLQTPVTLTCGNVVGAFRYEFRIKLPNGSFVSIDPSSAQSNVSEPYTISVGGDHQAQCRICTGSGANTCQPWEQI